MPAKTIATYSLVQPTELLLVYSEVPPFADLASGPECLGASVDLFFQELASLFGFICSQLHEGKNTHANSLERLPARSHTMREEPGGAASPATQQCGSMVAFIIFYHNRKGNANLNLGRRVQEADSSTEGFSDGINLVLSKYVQIFDAQ